jgi:SOS-response transcriptional repressor LexA
MVDKIDLRAQFSMRLHRALDDAGVRRRGRGVDIQKYLKASGVTKTPQAVSKWLNGEAVPEADSMMVLSVWLGVRREWLEYGITPVRSLPITVKDRDSANAGHPLRIPLLSWEDVARSPSALDRENAELHWLACPVHISSAGYAVEVVGDAMTRYGPGNSYPQGSIIFVDPHLKPEVGCCVIAKIESRATFKILAEDVGVRFLRSINPQYPTIPITETVEICGTIIGTFIPESPIK